MYILFVLFVSVIIELAKLNYKRGNKRKPDFW